MYKGDLTSDIQEKESKSTELHEEVDSIEMMKLDLPANIIKNKNDVFPLQDDVKGKPSLCEMLHCF